MYFLLDGLQVLYCSLDFKKRYDVSLNTCLQLSSVEYSGLYLVNQDTKSSLIDLFIKWRTCLLKAHITNIIAGYMEPADYSSLTHCCIRRNRVIKIIIMLSSAIHFNGCPGVEQCQTLNLETQINRCPNLRKHNFP